MTNADIEYLYDDLEWRGTLGIELLKRIPAIDGSSLFTLPEEVKDQGLDFRYGHGIDANDSLEMLFNFVVPWLREETDRFCICHDLDSRRGDPCLSGLATRFQRCRVLFHGDEVYYVASSSLMPENDELSFFLLNGTPQMLMCMGRGLDISDFPQEELSHGTLCWIAQSCEHVVRGICDDEAFAGFSFYDVPNVGRQRTSVLA